MRVRAIALTLLLSLHFTGCTNEESTDEAQPDPTTNTPVACNAEATVLTTDSGVEFVRTPDSCFESLPDWPFEPSYVEIDGLRQAYVDEGPADGPVVLLLHGQPSWSYLYRKMIPVLVEGGMRVIAMDHLGMGRSDKPTDIASYSYLGHYDRLVAFIEQLELRDIHLFGQDWGSLVGLRAVGLHPEWFARVAIGNGTLPALAAGIQPYPAVENPNEVVDTASIFSDMPAQQVPIRETCEAPDAPRSTSFGVWMEYAMKASSFHASEVLEAMTWFDLPDDEEAAYDAPFPSRVYMAGARSFPSLVNELPGVNLEAVEGLYAFDKPFVTIWGGNDGGGLGRCDTQDTLALNVVGAAGHAHTRLMEAGHFLQDDQGPAIAERLARFYTGNPVPLTRGSRYCEIGLITADDTGITSEVWGSQGISDCPAEAFEALDIATIQSETGADLININGPREWVPNAGWMRRFGEDSGVFYRTFGDLVMHRLATIHFPSGPPNSLYNPITVIRSTSFLFKAGEEIYELKDPNGNVYVMQALNQKDDPTTLSQANLSALASRLSLPDGWTYTARTLEEHFILRAEGEAYVLRDDLGNTYQRLTDFGSSSQQELPVLEDGTGSPCTSDEDCAGQAASHCLMASSASFCTVEGCEPFACGTPYLCCHSCNEAFASVLPFEGSACIPSPATPQLEGVPGCTCE